MNKHQRNRAMIIALNFSKEQLKAFITQDQADTLSQEHLKGQDYDC